MEKSMSKILICLYIIIALLAVNTLVLIVSNGSTSASSLANNSSDSNSSDSDSDSAENTEYDVSMFDEITTDDLESVMNEDSPQVIYIGRSTCGYCVAFLPTLQQAQKDYGYKTKYLDISKMTSEEQQEKLLSYDNDEKIVTDNFGSTPMVLIAKDGKVVKATVGYQEYEDFANFLEENGITK